MDLNDINAPQYVNFGSDSFQRDIQDSSVLSEDSTDDSKHSYRVHQTIEHDLSIYASPLSEVENARADINLPDETGVSIVDDTNLSLISSVTSGDSDEYRQAKENFPVQKNIVMPSQVKSAQNRTTIPEPFHFQTSSRMHGRNTESDIHFKEQDFTSQLRRTTDSQFKKPRLTKVQPFHLTEGKKRKRAESEFKSLAEQALAFQKKTPKRYHTTHKAFQPPEHWEPPHLDAKSPNLQAFKRRRIVNALSKEQKEEKEMEEMKAHEFRARPVNPKIYRRPSADQQQIKAMIKTKKFYLKTAQRALQHKRKSAEKPFQFKARPVPASILKGPIGLKEKPVIPHTKPISPKFESESRLEKRKQFQVLKEQVNDFPQKKAPKSSILPPPPPSIPWTKRCTAVRPFSFDNTDRERYLQKEKRIQEEIENEKKGWEFHAQLMPYPGDPVLPAVAKKPPTKPEPFNFASSDRNPKQFSFTSERNITFKAQPATVLKKEPFVPEKPPKQPIEILEFSLHTNKRASERQQLRQLKEAEEQEMEQVYQLERKRQEKLEKEELARFRREIVHKANPVRQYKPFEIKQGVIPLTMPQTPNFETEKRQQTRH